MGAAPLAVLYWSFWNFCVFSSWYEDVHVVCIIVRSFFWYCFHIVNLVIHVFHPQYIDSGYLVSTIHTILYQSFLKFAHVFSIVWRCACVCVFHIILAFIFFSFFYFVFFWLRCIDSGYLYFVIATPHTILYLSFWYFAHVFSRVCRSASGLDVIFKFIFFICFHFNFFLLFFTLTFSFSYLRFYESV